MVEWTVPVQKLRCVGTTQSGRQCKTSALNRCPQCLAFLCSWHVLWVKDPAGNWLGAHCSWCKVKMEGRSYGGWHSESPASGAALTEGI